MLTLPCEEDDAHADRSVAQAIDTALRLGHRVVFKSCLLQQVIELTLEDPRSHRSVRIVGQKKIVFPSSIRIAGFDALVGRDRS